MIVPRRFAKPPTFLGALKELTLTNIGVLFFILSYNQIILAIILATIMHVLSIIMTYYNPFLLKSMRVVHFAKNRSAATEDGEFYV